MVLNIEKLTSNLVINCEMLESGELRTVSLTAARISHKFTSFPLCVMFLATFLNDPNSDPATFKKVSKFVRISYIVGSVHDNKAER